MFTSSGYWWILSSILFSFISSGSTRITGGLGEYARVNEGNFHKKSRPLFRRFDDEKGDTSVVHELVLPVDEQGNVLQLNSDFYRNLFSSHGDESIEFVSAPESLQQSSDSNTLFREDKLLSVADSLKVPGEAAVSDHQLYEPLVDELLSRQLPDQSFIISPPQRSAFSSHNHLQQDHILFSSDNSEHLPRGLEVPKFSKSYHSSDRLQHGFTTISDTAPQRRPFNFWAESTPLLPPGIENQYSITDELKYNNEDESNQWTVVVTNTISRQSSLHNYHSTPVPITSLIYTTTPKPIPREETPKEDQTYRSFTSLNEIPHSPAKLKSKDSDRSRRYENFIAKQHARPRVTTYRPRIGLAQRLRLRFHPAEHTEVHEAQTKTSEKAINSYQTKSVQTPVEKFSIRGLGGYNMQVHKGRSTETPRLFGKSPRATDEALLQHGNSPQQPNFDKHNKFPPFNRPREVLEAPFNIPVDKIKKSYNLMTDLENIDSHKRFVRRPQLLFPGVKANKRHSSSEIQTPSSHLTTRRVNRWRGDNDNSRSSSRSKVSMDIRALGDGLTSSHLPEPQLSTQTATLNSTRRHSLSSLIEQMKQEVLNNDATDQPSSVEQYFKKIQNKMNQEQNQNQFGDKTSDETIIREEQENLAHNQHLYRIYDGDVGSPFSYTKPQPPGSQYVDKSSHLIYEMTNNTPNLHSSVNLKHQHSRDYTGEVIDIVGGNENSKINTPIKTVTSAKNINRPLGRGKPLKTLHGGQRVDNEKNTRHSSHIEEKYQFINVADADFYRENYHLRSKPQVQIAENALQTNLMEPGAIIGNDNFIDENPFADYKTFAELKKMKDIERLAKQSKPNNQKRMSELSGSSSGVPLFTKNSYQSRMGAHGSAPNIEQAPHEVAAQHQPAVFKWPSFIDSAKLFTQNLKSRPLNLRTKRSKEFQPSNFHRFESGSGDTAVHPSKTNDRHIKLRQARLFDGPLSVPIKWNFLPTLGEQTTDKIPTARTYVPILGQYKDPTATVPYMIQDIEHEAPIAATLSEVLLNEYDQLDRDTHSERPVLARPYAQARTDLAGGGQEGRNRPVIDSALKETGRRSKTNSTSEKRDEHPSENSRNKPSAKTFVVPYGQKLRFRVRKVDDTNDRIQPTESDFEIPAQHADEKQPIKTEYKPNISKVPVEVGLFKVNDNIAITGQGGAAHLSTPRPTRAVYGSVSDENSPSGRHFTNQRKKQPASTRRQSVYIRPQFVSKTKNTRRPDLLGKFSNLLFSNRNRVSTTRVPARKVAVISTTRPTAVQSQILPFSSNLLMKGMSVHEIGDRVITQVDPPQLRRQTF